MLKDTTGITKDEFVQRYWTDGESMNSIAKSLGFKRGDYLKPHVVRCGIPVKNKEQSIQDTARTGCMRKHDVNQYYFNNIDSESAWVVGLVASDGCIVNNFKSWQIVLKEKECLERIARMVGYSGSVREKSDGNAYFLQVHNRLMVNALLKLGLTSTKSLTLEYPNIDSQFDSHFIRGYFDGDGWFHAQKTQHSTGLYKGQIGITTGSPKFADAIVDKLSNIGLNPRLSVRERGLIEFPNGITSYRHKTYIIRMTGYSVAGFYEYIYDGSTDMIRLNRKYDKFSDWYKKYGINYNGKRLNPTPTKAIRFDTQEVQYV